jgi:hypothetical protein
MLRIGVLYVKYGGLWPLPSGERERSGARLKTEPAHVRVKNCEVRAVNSSLSPEGRGMG